MRTFEVWMDSGANIHSRRKVEVTLEELGYSEKDWNALSESSREEIMKDIAFEKRDWGFVEL